MVVGQIPQTSDNLIAKWVSWISWEKGKRRAFVVKMMQAKVGSGNLTGMHETECHHWVG